MQQPADSCRRLGAGGGFSGCARPPGARAPRCAAAFTLIELLVVVAIIAILTSLVAPSFQGLFGVVGRRGGANALSAALEQARLASLESGTSAFVGFATASTNQDNKFSSLIVFRSRRDDEAGAAYVPLSRWLRLPTGVHFDPGTIDILTSINPSNSLPKLAGETLGYVRTLEFDRFGRLKDQSGSPVIRLGEGVVSGSAVQFRDGGSSNAVHEVTILPLTGRVQIK